MLRHYQLNSREEASGEHDLVQALFVFIKNKMVKYVFSPHNYADVHF